LLVLCGYETYVIPRKDLGLQVLKNVRNLFWYKADKWTDNFRQITRIYKQQRKSKQTNTHARKQQNNEENGTEKKKQMENVQSVTT
jgi:hypothetical protein